MTMPISTKKVDAGRIKGPANVPNTVEIACTIQIPNTKLTRITFHGFNSGTATVNQAMANALWGSLSSAWGSNLGAYMHTATIFQNVQIRDMTSYTNPVFIGTGTAVAGTGTGAAMPPGAAIVMTENIAARGRGMKGRVYLGGWAASADVTTGGISGTVQTAINSFGTAVWNAINAQSLSPCVAQVARNQYQSTTGAVHPARVANHVLVNTYTCRDLIWDSQRRRAAL